MQKPDESTDYDEAPPNAASPPDEKRAWVNTRLRDINTDDLESLIRRNRERREEARRLRKAETLTLRKAARTNEDRVKSDASETPLSKQILDAFKAAKHPLRRGK